jgi:hypothetical protein
MSEANYEKEILDDLKDLFARQEAEMEAEILAAKELVKNYDDLEQIEKPLQGYWKEQMGDSTYSLVSRDSL